SSVGLYNSCAAIVGSSHNYFPENVYACAFQFSYNFWLYRSLSGAHILDYRAMDSRNIIYNKKLFLENRISFDVDMTLGAEDSDIGLQMKKSGLKAIYLSAMRVFHKEPETFNRYLHKKREYSRAL